MEDSGLACGGGGSSPQFLEAGRCLWHVRSGQSVWRSSGRGHVSAVAPETHRGTVWTQSHCCHRCARVHALAGPVTARRFPQVTESLVAAAPARVPASLGAPPPGAGGFSSHQRKAPTRLLPLPLAQPCGLHAPPRSCLCKGLVGESRGFGARLSGSGPNPGTACSVHSVNCQRAPAVHPALCRELGTH